MAPSALLVERRDHIVRLTLNRPEKLNSLTAALAADLIAVLEEVRAEKNARCVILAGAGRAFCAGQDLNERRAILGGEQMDLGDALDTGINRIVRLLRNLPQPVICAVRGAAAGAGANLALACDIVIAARSARFIQSFANIGLIPDGGGTWILPRLIGPARAAGMALLAEPVSGEQAAKWGLIWACVEEEGLEDSVAAMAGELSRRSPRALEAAKRALHASARNDLDTQLDLERDMQRELGGSDEYRIALSRFFATRGHAPAGDVP